MSDNKITAGNNDRILGSGVPGKEVKSTGSTGKLWLKAQGSVWREEFSQRWKECLTRARHGVGVLHGDGEQTKEKNTGTEIT